MIEHPDTMDFSHALNKIKDGHRLSRAGWNGEGMFVFLVNGSKFAVNREPLNKIFDEGTEVKDAVAVGGSVTVNGKVRDSAVAVGGSVILGRNAVVGKDVVSVGGAVKQELGSKIYGDVVEVNIPGVSAIIPFFFEDPSSSWFWIYKITIFLGFLALAVLMVAVLPKPFNLISSNVQQNLGKVICIQ